MSLTSHDTKSMALFCDFENVALGVRESRYQQFDISKVLERLLLKGSIVVKKAYCDWERYREFKAAMHQASFELIEIPHVRMSGKNSADIRMVVDALDLCYTKSHVDTFVIISGDSDFSPLVSKLRENNKTVIGVGVKNSTSDLLIANCDEFIYYDDLVRDQRQATGPVQRRRPGNAASVPAGRGSQTSGRVPASAPFNARGPAAAGVHGPSGASAQSHAAPMPLPASTAERDAAPSASDAPELAAPPGRAPRGRRGRAAAPGQLPVEAVAEAMVSASEAAVPAQAPEADAADGTVAASAAAPVEAAAKPVEAAAKPVEAAAKPVKAAAKPVKAAAPRRGRGKAGTEVTDVAARAPVAGASGDTADVDDVAGDDRSEPSGPPPEGQAASVDSVAAKARPAPRKRGSRKAAAEAEAAEAAAAQASDRDGERMVSAPGDGDFSVEPDSTDGSAAGYDNGTVAGDAVQAGDEASASADERTRTALELVVSTIEALATERGEDEKIWGSMVKQTLRRRRPGFNENYYGFRSFNRLLEEARDRGLIELELDDKSGGYTVRSLA